MEWLPVPLVDSKALQSEVEEKIIEMSAASKRMVKKFLNVFLLLYMTSIFIYMSWEQVDKYLQCQVAVIYLSDANV